MDAGNHGPWKAIAMNAKFNHEGHREHEVLNFSFLCSSSCTRCPSWFVNCLSTNAYATDTIPGHWIPAILAGMTVWWSFAFARHPGMDAGNHRPWKAMVGSAANVNSAQKLNHEGHREHEVFNFSFFYSSSCIRCPSWLIKEFRWWKKTGIRRSY